MRVQVIGRLFRLRPLVVLALGVVAAVVAFAATTLRASGSDLGATEAELLRQFDGERYFRPRSSLARGHVPCPEPFPSASCSALPAPGTAAFVRAAREAAKSRSGASTGARGQQLAGLASLLLGDSRSAVEALTEARQLDPPNESIAADLVAAHLVLSESAADPQALWRGLESVADLRPGRSGEPALLFNWALLLERSGLADEALAAWGRFLEVERDEGWREEARVRLALLGEPSVREAWDALRIRLEEGRAADEDVPPELVQPARLLVEDQLFDRWAVLELAGDPRAAGNLVALWRIARRLGDVQGDNLLFDAAGTVRESTSRRLLAEGHHAYALGRKAHESHDYEAAGSRFRTAADAFRSAGSPFEIWPRFYLATILHHRPDFEAAQEELGQLARDPRMVRYPVAAAYVEWMLGLGASRMADYDRAHRHYSAARDRFVATNEMENAAAMESEIGGLAVKVSTPDEAWRHHQAALDRLPGVLKSRRKQNILAAAAGFLRQQDADGAAELYLDATVREAQRSGAALSIALALLDRARFSIAVGQGEAAARDLSRALEETRAIPDPGLRSDTELDLMLTQADRLAITEPSDALVLLDEVLALARERRAESHLVRALVARSRVRPTGEVDAVVADLRAALVEIERQRWRLEDPRQRREFLSQAREILERLVRVEWQRRRFAAALEWVERFRARVVGESLGVTGDRGGPGWVSGSVPSGTAIVSYLVASDELFVWSSNGERVRAARVPLGEGELEELVAGLRGSLQRPVGSPSEGRRRLGELLIPAAAVPAGTTGLVFVPDGPLHSLPFAALPWKSGVPLIERFSVVVAPSIRTYLHLNADRQPIADGELLVVSGIEHDPAEFPGLPSLPDRWSGRRLEGIAGFRLLTGPAATPQAFVAEARRAAVLYFAGHAVAAIAGSEPGLVLAPGADGRGLLTPEDLRVLAPTRLRLAILSACGTGAGRASPLDGPRSLVEPFLAAGVGSVVGTLWEVDDRAAETFFQLLLSLRDRPDPVRAAQQAMLRRRPADGTWAAFQLYGGGSPTVMPLAASVRTGESAPPGPSTETESR